MAQPLAFIIEDDPSQGEAFKQAVELSGFTVHLISDSVEALPRIQAEQPQLIVLDMRMPRVNGLEILRAVRDDPQTAHIKIIIATASSHMLDESVHQMADLVLAKPVSMTQLMQFAARLIE